MPGIRQPWLPSVVGRLAQMGAPWQRFLMDEFICIHGYDMDININIYIYTLIYGYTQSFQTWPVLLEFNKSELEGIESKPSMRGISCNDKMGVVMGALAICKSTPPFCFHSPLSAMEIEVCAAGFAAMGTLGIWA